MIANHPLSSSAFMKAKLEYTAYGTSCAWAPVAENFSVALHSLASHDLGSADVLSGLLGLKTRT